MHHDQTCHVTPVSKHVDASALRDATTVRLSIDGIGCERCALRVRNALLTLDAVLQADVDTDTSAAVVAIDPRGTDTATLLAAIAAAGDGGRHRYRARVRTPDGI